MEGNLSIELLFTFFISSQVYSAVKKSTKQAASVFVLERGLLDRFDKSSFEITSCRQV